MATRNHSVEAMTENVRGLEKCSITRCTHRAFYVVSWEQSDLRPERAWQYTNRAYCDAHARSFTLKHGLEALA